MDAVELIRLNNLQLAARVVSDRLLLGVHQSRRNGGGTEFEQYRPYFPGDDLRQIDWKLYARSGRYQVRESTVESHLPVRMILDLSGSMNYTEEGVSRLDYCKVLLGSLAYMGFRQNDPMRLYTLKEGRLELQAGEGKNTFYRILYHLEKARAEGRAGEQNQRFPEFSQKRKELMILVSDLLELDEEWINLLREAASPHRQILIFQVLGRHELEFSLKGLYRFKDLETGLDRELEAESAGKLFRGAFAAHLEALDEQLRMPGIHLVRVTLDTPPAHALAQGLKAIRPWNS